MEKIKNALKVFITFFKIALFTFGGGYAMIAVLQREVVEKKRWIDQETFLDIVAIAESTPGPLAINSATYVGYKKAGVLGSVFATLGAVLPSFIIIFIISFFFEAFLALEYVKYAFMGIQVCVAFLIANAGIKMLKHLKPTLFNGILFGVSVATLVVLDLFAVNFSTIWFILIGGIVGVSIYLATDFKKRKKVKENVKEEEDK